MLQFNPQDPFPLLHEGSYTYDEAKFHAAQVDDWLGIDTKTVEQKVILNQKYLNEKKQHPFMPEYWSGLSTPTLQTPYTEIRLILSHLNLQAGQTLVDLGSGFGRMGHVIGRHYQKVNFIGYEYVEERVQESQRCLSIHYYPNVKIEKTDLSANAFSLVSADYYFMYDFGSRKAIEKTLEDLRRIAKTRNITVIGRGRNSRDLIERQHPWLSQVHLPQHYTQYSIYYS